MEFLAGVCVDVQALVKLRTTLLRLDPESEEPVEEYRRSGLRGIWRRLRRLLPEALPTRAPARRLWHAVEHRYKSTILATKEWRWTDPDNTLTG